MGRHYSGVARARQRGAVTIFGIIIDIESVLTGIAAAPILRGMDRKKTAGGAAALAIIVVLVVLLRRCGQSPPEPAAQPMTSFLAPQKSAAPKLRTAAKKAPQSKAPDLVAPRLRNFDELQANIRKYYPEAEHAAGTPGHVVMGLVVEVDGSVSGVHVETSGGAHFDEAAKKVVLAMRFWPATSAGKPVAVEIGEGIDFQFDGK